MERVCHVLLYLSSVDTVVGIVDWQAKVTTFKLNFKKKKKLPIQVSINILIWQSTIHKFKEYGLCKCNVDTSKCLCWHYAQLSGYKVYCSMWVLGFSCRILK